MKVNGLVLAAGRSSRMKDFKPLMKIGDKTMIETTVSHMFEAGVDEVTVVVGYRGKEVEAVLRSLQTDKKKLQILMNQAFAVTQMLDSIQVGVSGMGDCEYFFLTPGDMPAIAVSTYEKILQYAKNNTAKVIFPVIDGYRKHPPLIHKSCREEILSFKGEGLRELWKMYEGEIHELPISDRGCTMDADYQSDYIKICSYIQQNEKFR